MTELDLFHNAVAHLHLDNRADGVDGDVIEEELQQLDVEMPR